MQLFITTSAMFSDNKLTRADGGNVEIDTKLVVQSKHYAKIMIHISGS